MKYKFYGLDDLDKNDCSIKFEMAYVALEDVYRIIVDEDPAFKKRVSSVLDSLAEVANDFDESVKH